MSAAGDARRALLGHDLAREALQAGMDAPAPNPTLLATLAVLLRHPPHRADVEHVA